MDAILWAWERRPYPYPSPLTTPPHPTRTMTTKQIRDLQAFAVELTREGNHAAASAVLSLLAQNHG